MRLADIVDWYSSFEAVRTARKTKQQVETAGSIDEVLASMREFSGGPARSTMSGLCGKHMEIQEPRDLLASWTELEGLERERNVPKAKVHAHRALREVYASAWERAVVLGYKISRAS